MDANQAPVSVFMFCVAGAGALTALVYGVYVCCMCCKIEARRVLEHNFTMQAEAAVAVPDETNSIVDAVVVVEVPDQEKDISLQ